jgi:hypothetical protein
MRQIILVVFATFFVGATAIAQSENTNIFSQFYNNQIRAKSESKGLQIFAEINPQFFAFGGYGGGLGVEFSRFQTGFIYLNTKLTPTFRDAIFKDAKTITVPKNTAAEIFANVFLRKDRKGFYAGSILSYDWYSVTDDTSQQKEDFTKLYLVTRAGFRWFPFKEHLYIDGGYGVSVNLSGSDKRTLGASTYSPQPVIALPFFAVGGRVSLSN